MYITDARYRRTVRNILSENYGMIEGDDFNVSDQALVDRSLEPEDGAWVTVRFYLCKEDVEGEGV